MTDDPQIKTAGEKVERAGTKVEVAGTQIAVAGAQVKLAIISAVGLLLGTLITSVANVYLNNRNAADTAEKLEATGTETTKRLDVIHGLVNSSYTAAIKRELVLLEQIADERGDIARANPRDGTAQQAALRWRQRADETRRLLSEIEAVPPAAPGLFPSPAASRSPAAR